MNIFKKIYCRTFQTFFRIALPFLPYRNPEILTGVNAVPPAFKSKGIEKTLMIADPFVRKLGLTENLENALSQAGIKCVVYDGVVANPTSDNVEEARQIYVSEGCQAIIGFGGGSSMDCAKAAGARVACPKKSLEKMEGLLHVRKKLPPLLCIPTTAGTGSETTLAAVITDSKTRHKYPINDFSLIPMYAGLESEATRSLPPSVTATTGMDALTHAVEAYIGRSTTKETRAQAKEAVSLIFENLEKAYKDGNDMEARGNMLRASYLAGCAFTKSYVGYVHAVAHSLGGKYNIAHGLANAVLLPFVLEDYGKAAYKKLCELSISSGLCESGVSEEEGARIFIQKIRDMRADFGIPDVIPEIKEEDIPALSKTADHEGNPLYPVPALRDAKELERYYYMVMGKH